MKRDYSVELARIFGCLIVIGVHTCLPSLQNDVYDLGRVFISCLLADGVAIFWIIAGFFYFNSSYSKHLHKTLKGIGIPMIIFSLFSYYFSAWIFNDVGLLQSMYHSKEDYMNVFKTLLTWNNPFPCSSHLWYLYTYILLLLIFPLLKSFVDYLNNDFEKRTRIFIIMSFIFLLINDITSNKLASFSLNSVNALAPASIEVIYGYILYQNKDRFRKKKYIFIAPIVFLLVNLIRSIIQINRYYIDPANNFILYWYSSLGIICAISVIIFAFSLSDYLKSNKCQSIICYIASFTFYIYIIHTYVIALLYKYGIIDRITEFLSRHLHNTAFDIVYTLLIILIVFILSLISSLFIKSISKILHTKKVNAS